MKRNKPYLPSILATLCVIAVLLASTVPVAAAGKLTEISSLPDLNSGVVELSPYAFEVVDYSGSFGPSPYDDPEAILGKPTTQCMGSRIKLVEPAWGTDASGNKVITTLNSGEYITVRFDHQVENDPDNPYGIDLLVFGNSMFSGSGWVTDDTNMDTYLLNDPAGCFSEPVTVAVSKDGVVWEEFSSGPYGDSIFPTHAYEWDSINHCWTDNEMDFTKPVDPSITLSQFSGLTGAQAIALYNGSGGGTGFDLDDVGLDWIQYVRVTGSSPAGEIDAFADVAPLSSSVSVDIKATGAAGDIFDISGYSVPSGTVTEDSITVDSQTAMGALVHYCQDNSIDIELSDYGWGAYVAQIGSDTADLETWMYAYNQRTSMTGAADQPVSDGDSVHFYNYTLGYYQLLMNIDNSSIAPDDDITFTATWTDGNGSTSPVENADVLISDTMGAYQPEPGTSYGLTNSSGQLTLTWTDEGTFYPYAEIDDRTSISQYPTPTFTCSNAEPWDLNGDSIIDIFDVALVGMHWSETGTPGWIPEDLNPDGVIDIFDVAVIGMYWSE